MNTSMNETPNFRSTGGRADRAFRYATITAGGVVLITLGAIAVTMVRRAWPAFDKMGLDFITSSRWAPNDGVFGAKAFIAGSLIAAALALVLAVPVSIGIALFTTQVVPSRWRRPIIYLVDLLAVVPSVVFGLWGLLVFAPNAGGFYNFLHDALGPIPVLGNLFGPVSSGRNYFTAGLILAVMITPIITSLAREVIDTTPASDREAAYALGATRWEMIRGAGSSARSCSGSGEPWVKRSPWHWSSARPPASRPTSSRRATRCPRSSPTRGVSPRAPTGPPSSALPSRCSRSPS
jgi:phosphate transport system permease protein